MDVKVENKKSLLEELLEENKEEQIVSTKNILKEVFIEKDKVLVVILLYKDDKFKQIIKPYNLEICDKKIVDWVKDSCNGFEIKSVLCDKNSNIVSLIKPALNEKPYTLVLYSDTPMLTSETIVENLDYFVLSGMNVLKLPRGWVFKTEYIKTAESVSAVQTRQFNEYEFRAVSNLKQYSEISDILKQNILEKHLNNEVVIVDLKTTYIGADVIIEPGTKIEPNNVIKGLTYIGKNCVLEPFNYIKDSIISNNCVIRNSSVIKSKITENMVVGPFETIENKQS